MIDVINNKNSLKKHRRTKSSCGNDFDFMFDFKEKIIPKSETNIYKQELLGNEIKNFEISNSIKKINNKYENKILIIDSINENFEIKKQNNKSNLIGLDLYKIDEKNENNQENNLIKINKNNVIKKDNPKTKINFINFNYKTLKNIKKLNVNEIIDLKNEIKNDLYNINLVWRSLIKHRNFQKNEIMIIKLQKKEKIKYFEKLKKIYEKKLKKRKKNTYNQIKIKNNNHDKNIYYK